MDGAGRVLGPAVFGLWSCLASVVFVGYSKFELRCEAIGLMAWAMEIQITFTLTAETAG